MQRGRFYFFGLLIFGSLASNVAAQIYRWVDDKGTVHFADDRPRNQSGVKEVVEAGAQRTPMVRGGPEWRVDTPTPGFYEGAGPRDDPYDYEYYDEDRDAPRQGDTIIQVYDAPPLWLDSDQHQHKNKKDRNRDGDRGRHRDGDRGRHRDGSRHRDSDRGGHREREAQPPPLAPPPPRADQPPRVALPPRASSRALPLRR
jgi:hypothetical protein